MINDLTASRIAENQSRFREANEHIESAADSMHLVGAIPFICECPREPCMEIVQLTMGEYENVRESATCFLCAPGHQDIAVEAGVAVVTGGEDGRYVMVEKIGEAGEIAAERYDELSG